jgi:ATP-dependent RNA helicase DeaD
MRQRTAASDPGSDLFYVIMRIGLFLSGFSRIGAGMETPLFADLGLSAEVLKAITDLGYERSTQIQASAMPALLAGRDLVGQSATGSGKTAAFAIPAIEGIDPKKRTTQVLVLCPTRELAMQVCEEFNKLSKYKKGLRTTAIYGGEPYGRQFRDLEAGAHVVVGTPGRVIDHLERGSLKLDTLKSVILDEADRMLDMGFREDIERILEGAPKERQSVFFSATLPKPIQDMINRSCKNPELVKIQAPKGEQGKNIEQFVIDCDRSAKASTLQKLISYHNYKRGIIFCSTKIMVDELAESMTEHGMRCDRLHGDIPQRNRDRIMRMFREGAFEFLVATDVAARGLDVDDLEVVFNYDVPNDAEDYTHRIGRVGRAGRTGIAYTFFSSKGERFHLERIAKFTRFELTRAKIPTNDEIEKKRHADFAGQIRKLLAVGKYRKMDDVADSLLKEGNSVQNIVSAIIHLYERGPADTTSEPPVVRHQV